MTKTDWAKIQQDLAEVLSQQALKQLQTIIGAQTQASKALLDAFRKLPEIQVSDTALEALRGFNITASVAYQPQPACATFSSPQLAALGLYSWLTSARSKRARRRNRAKSQRLLRSFSDPAEIKQMVKKYRQHRR